ncbi:MAG: dihydrolipoyl dehydrogenase family protein [Chitinivibrionales bacterium]
MDILNNLSPLDRFNTTLIENVFPQPWINPSPKRLYDLIVIRGGIAGYTAAKKAAAHGARVALVQNGPLGGSKLTCGQIPLAIMAQAAFEYSSRSFEEGLDFTSLFSHTHFGEVMKRIRQTRSELSERYKTYSVTNAGIHLFFGSAAFRSKRILIVDGSELKFKRAIIASGANTVIPNIPGLHDSGFLTSENLFTLTEQPHSVSVFGSGPHACEIAQIFRHLGSQVIIICPKEKLLPLEDESVSSMIEQQLTDQGIRILHNAAIKQVQLKEEKRVIRLDWKGTDESISSEALIIAHKIHSTTDSLDTATADVSREGKRIITDKFLRTSNPRIYAAGDCCLRHKYSHIAERSGNVAAHNALFANKRSIHGFVIPTAISTYTPVARVGLNQKEALEEGIDFNLYQRSYTDIDRPVIDRRSSGYVQVLIQKKSDIILGATVIGAQSTEIISLFTLAMQSGIGLKHLDSMLYLSPAYAESIKELAEKVAHPQISSARRSLLSLWHKLKS